MSKYIGIDTSNYTTSVALYDSETNSIVSKRKLLPVSDGQLGLRQSDAVFHHTQQLPVLFEELFADADVDVGDIKAVCASFSPRKVQGSYMPCFTVGSGFARALSATLGLFIPLIVVNCIVLGRAEAFACKNSILDSALDGIGIGLGFTLSLTTIGFVRELLGGLSVFGNKLVEGDGMLAFVLAPGAFLVLGYLMVLFNKATKK